MQKRHPAKGGAVLLGGERANLTQTTPILQPATVTQLRAMRLIALHRVQPSMAITLAELAYGGAA